MISLKPGYFNSSVIEFSKESTGASKKYCILQGKYRHFTDSCKDLCAMVGKHKQKKIKNYGKSNKELYALIETKFQKVV